jgi:hypothetical protein
MKKNWRVRLSLTPEFIAKASIVQQYLAHKKRWGIIRLCDSMSQLLF